MKANYTLAVMALTSCTFVGGSTSASNALEADTLQSASDTIVIAEEAAQQLPDTMKISQVGYPMDGTWEERGSDFGAWIDQKALLYEADIMTYEGYQFGNYMAWRKLDIAPMLSNDEQCADVCIHVRALYDYEHHRPMNFKTLSGADQRFATGTQREFEHYLKRVYAYAN